MPPNKPPSEADILRETLLALGARDDCRVWRNNVGVGRDFTGRVIRFGVPGSSDVFGIGPFCCPHCKRVSRGRFLSLECKTATGRLTPEQKAWGEMVQRMGGLFAVIRDPSDGPRIIEDATHA